MKTGQNRGQRKRFVLYTLIVSLIFGIFSVISDNLPNIRDGITPVEFIISYLAIMINSLPTWFIIAMVTGYIFASNIKESIIRGAICILCAITSYFVIGQLYSDIPVATFKEWVPIFMNWYGMSLLGGMIGGCVGFLLKKTPYVLLIVLSGLLLQLYLNGASSWNDVVGIAQNVTFCLMVVGIILYLWMVTKEKKTTVPMLNRKEQ
ncbi:hypothetical protein [Fictibacillus terranigra]|uniref:Uncharacterized protein n=1 Tax=Fictibacillus terranigra TaxID=3058424 RepID=A0ABT8E4T2_9BACL|nr:hypothetical protein [Fictibacillus sp. CENA-BCM004]MDN4072915.1 hypothetical protein [Fictibacillus sp. CENA-BCM004]